MLRDLRKIQLEEGDGQEKVTFLPQGKYKLASDIKKIVTKGEVVEVIDLRAKNGTIHTVHTHAEIFKPLIQR